MGGGQKKKRRETRGKGTKRQKEKEGRKKKTEAKYKRRNIFDSRNPSDSYSDSTMVMFTDAELMKMYHEALIDCSNCGKEEGEMYEVGVYEFLYTIKVILLHITKAITRERAVMDTTTPTTTLDSLNFEEKVETSIVFAIEGRVIGSNKNDDNNNVFSHELHRLPVNSISIPPGSEWETVLDFLDKIEREVKEKIEEGGKMASMDTAKLLDYFNFDENVKPRFFVLAMERAVTGSYEEMVFTQVLHRLQLHLYNSTMIAESVSVVQNPPLAISKCVVNPCDFLIPCKADPPSGLFIRPAKFQYYVRGYDFISLEDPINRRPPVPFRKELDFDPCRPDGTVYIIYSCNGVLLCSSGNYAKFYLYNPTLDTFTTLPKLDGLDSDSFIDMAIAFDPSKSPYYQVIALWRKRGKRQRDGDGKVYRELLIQVTVYSSQTGQWRDCGHKPDMKFHGHGVFCNHAIYWLQAERVVCFNFVEEKFQYIDHPTTFPELDLDSCRLREAITRNFLVKSGRDTLLYVCLFWLRKILVRELGRDDDLEEHSRWSVKYFVDLERASASTDLLRFSPIHERDLFDLVYFWDGEKEEDTFLVLFVSGHAIRFDMESGNFKSLGAVCHISRLNDWYDIEGRVSCFPFQRVSASVQKTSDDEDANKELISLVTAVDIQ